MLVLVATLLTVAVGVVLLRSGSTAAGGRAQVRPTYDLVAVQRRTLTLSTNLPGTLGYGASASIPLRAEGTVTWLPRSGARITRGEPLLRVDDQPVVLMIGNTPAWRSIGSPVPTGKGKPASPTTGRDVRELEQNLSALGYGGFTVDDAFTDGTAVAVRRWQHDLGIPETGAVDLGRVVFLPRPIRAVVDRSQLGEPVSGAAVQRSPTVPVITVKTPADAAGWAVEGAPVTVTLPDQAKVGARVVDVGFPGDDGSVPVQLRLLRPAGNQTGAVTVSAVTRRRSNVLTVPVTALVALAEGGYGVQLRDGRYVPVTPGMYADSLVEISGRVAVGASIRVPR